VLLTIVCVVIVAVTEIALRAVLVGQLDNRVVDASNRTMVTIKRDTAGMRVMGQGAISDAQEPDTLSAEITDGTVVVADVRSVQGDTEPLPASLHRTLLELPVDGRPRTRDFGEFGEFRLVAVRPPTPRGMPMPDTVLITGLPTAEMNDVLLTTGLILGGVSLVGLLAAAGAGALIVRRALDPLQRVAATASRVADLPLDHGEVELAERVPKRYTDPNTEVGRVGLAFNRMLGNVNDALAARQESETRVRQFVADASHELRTPLAAVRGYAELIRRRDDDVAPEVSHAIGRVESEAARMTTLVEDLLLLARLDSGRPLDHATVDLSRLVVDVVSDAQVAGRDHEWRLDVPADPVTVPGDDARLHQVLANLLSNARTHTPPGTTVTIGLSTTDRAATVTVTDDGPGIPADLQPEVFERFARGDSSRSRAAGSTGLGLAIVAAVVQAHGGHVAMESRPGKTTFTVHLPLTGPTQD